MINVIVGPCGHANPEQRIMCKEDPAFQSRRYIYYDIEVAKYTVTRLVVLGFKAAGVAF